MREESSTAVTRATANHLGLLYTIYDNPPWYTCLLMGLQHFLMMFGSTAAIPIIVTRRMCMAAEDGAQSEVFSTMFFMAGVATLLQTTVGIRLPIVQGGSFSFLVCTFAILDLPQWTCPENLDMTLTAGNQSSSIDVNSTDKDLNEVDELWKSRMREIQGGIIVAAFIQLLIGYSGVVGTMLRYLGPLAIAPTITLVGISLFREAANYCAKQWWIALVTMLLVTVFSQYLHTCYYYTRAEGCHRSTFPVFQLFPVILGIGLSWILCVILTYTDVLPSDPNAWGYYARTDSKADVLIKAAWFRVPYPFQWGIPTFSAASVFGMLAGMLTGIIESTGDYYACARLSGAPPPPIHAVNRGIFVEAIACVFSGMWGSGNGVSTYSQNVGAIGITKVGSRRVIQVCGLIIIFFAIFSKFGALFVTIPDPIIGGILMIMFGMVGAVGISNLQFVNMNSPRNLFIFGFSLFMGISLSQWIKSSPGAINTGISFFDQLFTVFLSTSMFIGGALGLILDNTIPGTEEERGIKSWRQQHDVKADIVTPTSLTDELTASNNVNHIAVNERSNDVTDTTLNGGSPTTNDVRDTALDVGDPSINDVTEASSSDLASTCYDLPFQTRLCSTKGRKCSKYVPICPGYTEQFCCRGKHAGQSFWKRCGKKHAEDITPATHV